MSEYKDSLNLPKTDFPMKASLAQQEPKRLADWQEKKIYQQIRERQQGKTKFVLHDGPPYANGHLHCGHALNKILKDMVIKSKTLSGYDAPFVPGWDCHGLPIELNVEKKIGKVGARVSSQVFRAQCRAYAQSQIDIQRNEFQRLGVLGDWQNPYATMDFKYEAEVIRSFNGLMQKGLVYQGFKPVHWCIECGSALAEAEVDYEEKSSFAIDVAFDAVDALSFLKPFQLTNIQKRVVVPIWTTTPWTLPANEAICLHPNIRYGLYDTPDFLLLLATELAPYVLKRVQLEGAALLSEVDGRDLSGFLCWHPFLDKQVPIILGDHVTIDAGTGAVHTAPAHGVEDYEAGKFWKLTFQNKVLPNGCYTAEVPFFAGVSVLKANEPVIEKLRETQTLLAQEKYVHSYPHCWRHKTPMIFLATPQWFISMDKTHLRERLLDSLNTIRFIPEWGPVRMGNMISERPDWCISRQRVWGTPIPIFIHKETRLPHPNSAVLIEQVAKLVEKKGIEAWYELAPETLLGEEANAYDKVLDTLDVWFDAGVSHACVLKQQSQLTFPADLYMEGSDQYRGWFNSSLTTSVALNDVSPYKMILSHGYTVDAHGKKLSKSQGNYVDLEQLITQHGADIIRLWVASTDSQHEVSISNEILNRLGDAYRRIRNTARFLLANLFDFDPTVHSIAVEQMLEFDQYMLGKAQRLQKEIIQAYDEYQFHVVYQKVFHFCNIEMGSFYLDIIKDRQYTVGKNSVARRSCQTVMYHLLQALVRWIAPFLSFTAEEIWSYVSPPAESSVFLTAWYDAWPSVASQSEDWDTLQCIREEVNKALEIAREAKHIGSGLAAEVTLYAQPVHLDCLSRLKSELKFFFITSGAKTLPYDQRPKEAYVSSALNLAIVVQASEQEKCVRCWQRSSEIGQIAEHPMLCHRCAETVSGRDEIRHYV